MEEIGIAIGVIACVIIIIFVIFMVISSSQDNKMIKKTQEKHVVKEEKYNEYKLSLIEKYGELTEEIRDYYKVYYDVLIFNNASIIVINSSEFKYEDILEYQLLKDETVISEGTVKTSLGSAVGRAVVGGIISGGVGAIIGASTAKREIETSQTSFGYYKIMIRIRDRYNPFVLDLWNGKDDARKLEWIFSGIIAENNKKI